MSEELFGDLEDSRESYEPRIKCTDLQSELFDNEHILQSIRDRDEEFITKTLSKMTSLKIC